MAISGENSRSSDLNIWKLCTFWQSTNHTTSSSTSSTQQLHHHHHHHHHHLSHRNGDYQPSDRTSLTSPSKPTVSSVARSFLPAKRRLRLDPPNRLYFPYEPGKQVRSAVRIKNTSKSYVAFKFQTTSPKSCYMRPPGGILAPGESLVATVFKFVEQPENNEKPDLKTNVKFKIMSLKVKEGIEYAPELFEELRDQATVERILRVVFLDPERPCSAMDKLKRQLAEADAAVESQKKPPPTENGPKVAGEGLVIDEWKERREKYLAQQQGEAVEST